MILKLNDCVFLWKNSIVKGEIGINWFTFFPFKHFVFVLLNNIESIKETWKFRPVMFLNI
jgi:hypothetical protein